MALENMRQFVHDEVSSTGDPETLQVVADAAEHQQHIARAEELKEVILHRMEQGASPQELLYDAVEALGLLTEDQRFTETSQAWLSGIYEGVSQMALDGSEVVEAEKKLQEIRTNWETKMRKRLRTQKAAHEEVTKAFLRMDAAMQGIGLLDWEDEIES